jgi:hypothetical protein
MDGIASLLLATALISGTSLPLPEREPSLDRPAHHVRLELDWRAEDRDNGGDPLEPALALFDRVSLDRGWLAVEVAGDFSLLVDVRIDAAPRTPDPARPDPQMGVLAALGIGVRRDLTLPRL